MKNFFLDNVETIKFYNGNINEIVVIKKIVEEMAEWFKARLGVLG